MKKVGLTFGGGGSRGAYQIGMWKAMKDLEIDKEINMVSGTSVGALNAILFALGDYQAAFDIWEKVNAFDMLAPNITKAEGWFSRSGLKKYIDTLDFNKLKTSKVDVYITVKKIKDKDKFDEFIEKIINKSKLPGFAAFLRSFITLEGMFIPFSTRIASFILAQLLGEFFSKSIITPKEAVRHFLSDDIEYYHVNSMSVDDIKTLMLASSAISFVYESVHFHKQRYIDAGGTAFGNVPITPLYKNGCKKIYVAPLDKHFNINKIKKNLNPKDNISAEKDFPNCEFTVIKPSKDLGFILDFTKYRFNKNFKLGESDTLKILNEKIHNENMYLRLHYIEEIVKRYKKI